MEQQNPSSVALIAMLDVMARDKDAQTVVNQFTDNPSTSKNWRYYLSKYPAMRDAQMEFAGIYAISEGAGYAICIPKSDSCDSRSNHHDAYLLAVSGITPDCIANEGWPRCFPGYVTESRHLKLRYSGIKIRCVDAGWQFSDIPADPQQHQVFERITSNYPHYQSQNSLYAVP